MNFRQWNQFQHLAKNLASKYSFEYNSLWILVYPLSLFPFYWFRYQHGHFVVETSSTMRWTVLTAWSLICNTLARCCTGIRTTKLEPLWRIGTRDGTATRKSWVTTRRVIFYFRPSSARMGLKRKLHGGPVVWCRIWLALISVSNIAHWKERL